MTQPHEKRTIEILRSIQNRGGLIREGQLPHEDDLIMFRLTNKKFVKAVGVNAETGESLFCITKEGEKEAGLGGN